MKLATPPARSLPAAPPPRYSNHGKPPKPPTGTALADIDLFNSGNCLGRARHGGARNRADRITLALNHKQAAGVIAAAETALVIGLPFNRHWTVHWGLMGVPDSAAGAATGRLLKLCADWLRRRGHRTAWAYVREHDPAAGKGSHVHILIHLPPALGRAFGSRAQKWVRRAAGAAYERGASHSRPVVGFRLPPKEASRYSGAARAALDTARVDTAHDDRTYRANLNAALAYVLKAVTPAVAAEVGPILSRTGEGGPVMGKRCGWSQNLRTRT